MHTVALAALLTVLPSAPPRISNQLPLAVTDVHVAGPAGTPERVIARVAAGQSVEVPGAQAILRFTLPACGARTREAIAATGDLLAARACLQSSTLRTAALEAVLARGLGDELGALLFGRGATDGAKAVAGRLLPDLVTIEIDGGEAGALVTAALARLGMDTPGRQLRAVERERRPELLAVLGRHEDGRAFGLLVRASLESSIEAERAAAARALADYPEDAVARLGTALDDPKTSVRMHAEEALRSQDMRSIPSLRSAIEALGGSPWAEGSTIEYVQQLIRVHDERRIRSTEEHVRGAWAAVRRQNQTLAEHELSTLQSLDRERWGRERVLRGALARLSARQAIAADDLAEAGRLAVERLFDAASLDPRSPELVETAIFIAQAFRRAGYPASASRVLAPFEDRDRRVARLRVASLRDEVGRMVSGGDRAAARLRLAQLMEEGHSDLADRLDDEFGVRSDWGWMMFPLLSLMLCGGIGLVVRHERRRRHAEFRLIESEGARGLFREGVYR